MERTYRRVARLIETELEDELVLLDPETQQMYSLNATGRSIWRTLPAAGVEPLVDALVEAYEVDRTRAREDVGRMLRELIDAGIVEEYDG